MSLHDKEDLFKISIMDGDQFGSDFVGINPNSKIPALVEVVERELRPLEYGEALVEVEYS